MNKSSESFNFVKDVLSHFITISSSDIFYIKFEYKICQIIEFFQLFD